MPSLKTIRNRIRSVKNTQQITRAMKMVAAAKLRRAQEAVLAARPYSVLMRGMLDGIAARGELSGHPLLQAREMKRIELVVLTSDRGLCGGFNANVIRRVLRFLIEKEGDFEKVTLTTIGRKGFELFRRRGLAIRRDHPRLSANPSFAAAEGIAEELSRMFVAGELDGVFLVFNEFVSAVTQRVAFLELLPVAPPEQPQREGPAPVDYLYEPGRDEVLRSLLPRYLANRVYQAMLESAAAEQAARMTAMENATTNASEMIDKLTLLYNRSRQAAITKELMEVVSGAEALK